MDLGFEERFEDPEEREKIRKAALDQLLGKWNQPITRQDGLTVAEFLTEFLKAATKWNMVDDCKDFLLGLIHKIVDKDHDFPKSLSVLKCRLKDRNLLADPKLFHGCHVCGHFVEKISKNVHHCFHCGLPDNPTVYKRVIDFTYTPISPSIKLGLESGLYKDCSQFLHLQGREHERLTFLDGAVCKEMIQRFGENILFIAINSDSGQSAKSSGSSKWILQHHVVQPNHSKPKPKMNTLYYMGPAEKTLFENRRKPSQLYDTLYWNLIEELKKLSTIGLTYKFNSVERNVKVILLSHNMDSMERYPVLGTRHFLGAFGCAHGLANPPVDPILKRRCYVPDINGERCTPRDSDHMKVLVSFVPNRTNSANRKKLSNRTITFVQ